ncbi:hypothetical protein R75465_07975 [Paraburkholderia aspalathi]|nr:hypothetical protein R75465_07975 [Paraburkholderia aspalathi]
MMAHFDWTGQRWGALVAIQCASNAQRNKTGARWVFRCDCTRVYGSPVNFHLRHMSQDLKKTLWAC